MDTSTVEPWQRLRVAQDFAAAQWHAQRGALLPWAPVCFGLGIGLYFALPFEPSVAQVQALGIATLVLLAGALAPALYAWRVGFISLALILCGVQYTGWRAQSVAAPVLQFRYYGPIEGRIVHIDRSMSDKIRLTLDQVRLRRVSPDRTPERVRVSLHGSPNAPGLKHGDLIGTTGHLSPPSGPVEPGGFDFQRKSWFERLGAVGYTRIPVVRTRAPPEAGLGLWIGQTRRWLAEVIRVRVGGPEGPFAAAILTGERSGIPRDALEALRATNLAHLLAISGLHMGLLTGTVFAAIRLGFAFAPGVALRLPVKKIAAVVALLTGAVYLALSGANVATQRAFLMVAVFFVAICLDRRALTLRSVAIAAMIVLLIRPESLTSPGFQMSFAATTALVAAFASWRDFELNRRFPRWLHPVLGVLISSLVAGLATAPYGAAHFNQIAHYGLLANVLSVPVMGLLVMPGALIAGVLSSIGLEAPGIWMMQLGLGWILFVADGVSQLDGAVSKIAQPGAWVLPTITLGGLILCLVRGPGRVLGAIVMVGTGLFWTAAPRPALLLSESGALLGVLTEDGRALNKGRGDGFSARVWLENDGDTATQEEAAARAEMSRNFATLEIDAARILYHRDKDLTGADVSSYCANFDVVLVPQWSEKLPCRGATEGDLRQLGALAIYTDEKDQPRLVFSNSLRGARPWTGLNRSE